MVSGVNLGRPPDNLGSLLELQIPENIVHCIQPEKSTDFPEQIIESSILGLNPTAPAFSPLLSTSNSCKSNVALSQVQEGHLQANLSRDCSTARHWSGDKQAPVIRSTIGCLEKSGNSKNESLLPLLPFMDDPGLSAITVPAKPVLRANSLQTAEVKIPNAEVEKAGTTGTMVPQFISRFSANSFAVHAKS